jgi:high-affinity Fe2+/Pb2+ permease
MSNRQGTICWRAVRWHTLAGMAIPGVLALFVVWVASEVTPRAWPLAAAMGALAVVVGVGAGWQARHQPGA